MKSKESIQEEIDEIKDRIRLAPEGTPHREVFLWYREIDDLEALLNKYDHTERIDELESIIEQLQLKFDKAETSGGEKEINLLRKEIKKFEKELDTIRREENTCGCAN